MGKREQAVLAARLHRALVDQMGSVIRLTYIMTGRSLDPAGLVEAIERDLRSEEARIGTEASVYDAAELRVRRDIAWSVVAAIRLEVTGRG